MPDLFMVANLKLSPSIPWLLPATALWLWILSRYLNGEGWPRSTAESRRRDLRARVIPIQYGVIGHLSVSPVWKTGMDSAFITSAVLIVIFGILAVPAFRRLATLTQGERGGGC